MENRNRLTTVKYEGVVIDCLRVMARFTRARRVHLLFFSRESTFSKGFYTWAEDASEVVDAQDTELLRLDAPWWMHTLRNSRFTRFEDVSTLPDEVSTDRDALIAQGVHSISLIPVYDGKRLVGTIRIENPTLVKEYTGPEMDLLQIAAQLTVQVLRVSWEMDEMKRDRARMAYQNSHDELTGLPNRALFLDRIRAAFEGDVRLFAVMVADLGYYQLIQERFGREVGDRLLIAALNKLRSILRASDTLARLGEDQFGILLENIHESGYVESVATRIVERFKEPLIIEGHKVAIAANIGVALRNGHHRTADLILQEATIAMVQAKQSGSGRYLMFNSSMREALIGRMEMENDLRNSLEHQQLILHYQPITELRTGRLIGFEALVRWLHPQRGMIWPNDFIQLSEETGLIIPLGKWVLHEACRQMRVWHDAYPVDPPFTVSVNISPKQLEQPDFSENVALTLEETGLPPACLRLEITESTVVQNSAALVTALDSLRQLGVQLYIDDFGTGYSSLGYLDSLPVDAIKIDRTFITNLGRVKSSLGVIQAIIQLAHELNIEVVAEGVETFEQHKELKRLQCEFMQGFYISEPLDSGAVERYIAGRSSFNSAYP